MGRRGPAQAKMIRAGGSRLVALKILKGTWPRKGAVKVLLKVLGKVRSVTMCYRLSQIG